MLSRLSFLRNASRPIVNRRFAHQEVQKAPGSVKEDGPKDFRPPWVYMLSRFGSYAVIPVVAVYAVFLYDWGDHEHVFMPPRRWLARTKQQIWTLSPEEEKMLNAEIVEQRVHRLPPGTVWDLSAPPPIPRKTSSSSES